MANRLFNRATDANRSLIEVSRDVDVDRWLIEM